MLFVLAVALSLGAFVASVVHSASWSPAVPGYMELNAAVLRDPSRVKYFNGQQVWIRGGVIWADSLVPPLNGGYPVNNRNWRVKLGPCPMVRTPPNRTAFSPYGVLHVERDREGKRLELSLDMAGETDKGLVAKSASMPAMVLVIAAMCALCWSLVIALRRAHELRAAYRFGPTCCKACGYDLRGTTDRCPECGAIPAASCGEDSLSKTTSDEPVNGV